MTLKAVPGGWENEKYHTFCSKVVMMHFTFDKDRYHEQTDMSSWCTKNIGAGKWISEPFPKDWTGLPDWTIHCMFGQTTIAFKHEKDYHWFLLRWA